MLYYYRDAQNSGTNVAKQNNLAVVWQEPFGSHHETSWESSMAASENHEAPDVLRRLFTVRYGSLFFLLFCVGITFVSVGITAALALALGPLQAQMGPIGQIFESVNAAFSGLGFIALVITFRLQYDELRMQRRELKNQHTAMTESQGHLGRSAECDIRARHVELIRMAMEDQDLAEFWPAFQAGLSTTRTKQYNYANLVVQHQRMMYSLGVFTRADVLKFFQYLFASPIMRGYWEARMIAREVALQPRSDEWAFEQLIDVAYNETRPPEPPSTPAGHADAEVVDLDSRRQPESDAA
jgi:hypothetical protein